MSQQPGSTRRPRRILLVDDDPLVVKVYAERMRYEGWIVAVARDGWDAVQECRRERFDVILLDIRMPFHDGLDVLREIRNGQKNPDTPVWILTSLSEGDEIEDSLRLGADGVFHKAVTRPDDLVAEMEMVFRSGRAPARAIAAAPVAAPARESSRGAPAAALMEGGPRPAPAAPDGGLRGNLSPEADREFSLYVNPLLGDGSRLARALGLSAAFPCPACGGQLCLKLRPAKGRDGIEFRGRFECQDCKESL